MEKQTEYMTGWIDTDIHDFLSAIDEPSSSMAYALITCLDSSPNLESLASTSKHISRIKAASKLTGKGLMLTTRQLIAAERRERAFFGFDEVWFFDKRPVSPKPDSLIITGPDRLTSEFLDEHQGWLHASGCTLGLGDGTGMNFCLRVRGAARYIVRAFSEGLGQTKGSLISSPVA